MIVFLAALCVSCFVSGCSRQPFIIAHRGNSSCAPENTLAAINSAWQVGADAVEIDIHLTKDNTIVVHHDFDTESTSGKKLVIADSVYADLAKLDVGSRMCPSFKNEHIPLLEEVIETIPAGRKLFIEIKCGSEIIPYLKGVIEKSRKKSSVVIISFNLDVLKNIKVLMPSIPMYLLVDSCCSQQNKQLCPYSPDLIKDVAAHNLDGLDLNYRSLTQDYVAQVHKAGFKVFVWTIDDADIIRGLSAFGVDGFTTNWPQRMKCCNSKHLKKSSTVLNINANIEI
jgi:glycerophosphoryl diester phosphodiesterase